MAKKVDLDTPFKKGEKVLSTRQIAGLPAGTKGKVQLCNGLGNWTRYWVLFEDNEQVGQVNHADLVRPLQLDEWQEREENKEKEAEASKAAAEAAAANPAPASTPALSGAAAAIPADLLERSRAAKARLLG